jgi:hypothetical protein
MNIFVIHKGSDSLKAQQLAAELSHVNPAPHLLMLECNPELKRWKKEARTKISNSDCVLVALGSDTASSKNVDYEIKLALHDKKQIFLIRLNQGPTLDPINESLFLPDKFMKIGDKIDRKYNRPLFKEIQKSEFGQVLRSGFDFDIERQLQKTDDPKRMEDLIEQYKVYLGTSEEILTRRTNVSNFYTTLNSSIIGIFTTVAGILISVLTSQRFLVVALLGIVLSAMGILLSVNWAFQLKSYGALNSAKMRVITAIEKHLPANIYETEWRVMSEKVGSAHYRPFTVIEMFIPKIFIGVYGVLQLASVLLLVLDLCKVIA